LSGRLVASDFVIDCNEVRTVQLPEIWKFIWVFYTGTSGLEADDDAQNVRVGRARGKDNDPQNLSKMIM